MFFAFTTLAEWRPVPIDPAGRRLVSLAFVFIIASQLLFGWEWSVLTGALSIGVAMASVRVDFLKVCFNSAAYALAAALAAIPELVFGNVNPYDYGRLTVAVLAGGALFVLANVMLVCIAIGLVERNLAARSVPRSPPALGPDLRDHDLRRDAGRHLLAAVGSARDPAQRAALRAHALPALVRPSPGRGRGGGDRQPDRAQEPPRVRAGVRRRARRREAGPRPVRALPDRHRPLQAGQRPARPPLRRRGAERARRRRSRRPHPAAATASAATSSRCCSKRRLPRPPRRRTTSSGASRRRSRAWCPSPSRSAPASRSSPTTPTTCTR